MYELYQDLAAKVIDFVKVSFFLRWSGIYNIYNTR